MIPTVQGARSGLSTRYSGRRMILDKLDILAIYGQRVRSDSIEHLPILLHADCGHNLWQPAPGPGTVPDNQNRQKM